MYSQIFTKQISTNIKKKQDRFNPLRRISFPNEVAISVAVIFGHQAIRLALTRNFMVHHRSFIFPRKGEKFEKNPIF